MCITILNLRNYFFYKKSRMHANKISGIGRTLESFPPIVSTSVQDCIVMQIAHSLNGIRSETRFCIFPEELHPRRFDTVH